MTEVISVRFRGGCKSYYFAPGGLTVRAEQPVVVETAQGVEYGICAEGNHTVPDQAVVQPLRRVLRLATQNDRNTVEYNRRRESDAFDICERKIQEHKLDMRLVRVEYSFDGSKILFFFTADGRVDFRELVKDLASVFHARIELRQIGVRDESKMLGGLGICGRPLCCADFLNDFLPVSIKMAKTQNLSLNPAKISGTCGRLMCCLKYEQEAYEDAARRMPKNDSFVQTPDGVGDVESINLVKEEVLVRLDDQPDAPRNYKNGEIRVLRQGKGSRDGIVIPSDRPGQTPSRDRYPKREEIKSEFVLSAKDRPSPVSPDPLAADPAEAEARGEMDRRRRRRRGSRRNDSPRSEAAVPKKQEEKTAANDAAPQILSVAEKNPSQTGHSSHKAEILQAESSESVRPRSQRRSRYHRGNRRNNPGHPSKSENE